MVQTTTRNWLPPIAIRREIGKNVRVGIKPVFWKKSLTPVIQQASNEEMQIAVASSRNFGDEYRFSD